MEKSKDFHIIVPATLSKSDDGEWIVAGLASSPTRDAQNEVVLPEGIDATPIDEGRGILNWDHGKGPENTIGLLDSYKISPQGFFVKGRLLKQVKKAQAAKEIMDSLGKSDKGRMGMSIEGKIIERAGENGTIIKRCRINAVALTMNPVNQDSYLDLVKSMTANSTEVEWDAQKDESREARPVDKDAPIFSVTQVLDLVQKALGVDASYTTKQPADLSGGNALAQEDLDKKIKTEGPTSTSLNEKPKKLKRMSKDMYKASMIEIMNNIQELYPNNSRSEIWEAVKDRLDKKFPSIKGIF